MSRTSSNKSGKAAKALVCMAALLAIGASEALAEAGPAMPAPNQQEPGERAIDEWEAANPWGYGTELFFSLSRGLQEEDISQGARIALYFVTVPLDLAQLPAAAIGGFWGD